MKNNYKQQVIIGDANISSAMMYKYNLIPTIYFDSEVNEVVVAFDCGSILTDAMNELQSTGTIEVDALGYPAYHEDSIAELASVSSYIDSKTESAL